MLGRAIREHDILDSELDQLVVVLQGSPLMSVS